MLFYYFLLTCVFYEIVYSEHVTTPSVPVGSDRRQCPVKEGLPQPPERVDTHKRLEELRRHMARESSVGSLPLDAYIITSDDEHQSELVMDHDKRREYLTGFTGSVGQAIVTRNSAALFVDGRYHIQADKQLSCDWLLMRVGRTNVPSQAEWLKSQLPRGARVGADPKLINVIAWVELQYELEQKSIQLIEVKKNLIDLIWPADARPRKPKEKVFALGIDYAGVPWEVKVANVRKELNKTGADAVVVTALDEIAWLFNIRGRDDPYSPVVQSYAIVTRTEIYLYIDQDKIDDDVRRHLKTFFCTYPECVRIQAYDNIWRDLRTFSQAWNLVILPTATPAKQAASQAIFSAIPEAKRLPREPIVNVLKAKKNPVEIMGMERAHIRDAAAFCDFMAYFEEKFYDGENWTEYKLAKELDSFRYEQNLSLGLSFPTIVGFGPNGASPHYEPNNLTSLLITEDSTIVIDSGGQYLDGTTDLTRTLHMGEPTQEQKDAYTRILIGQIQVSKLVFPGNVMMSEVDILARAPLWEGGLDYMHGTGHGIGAFLYVHESPIVISYTSHSKQKFKEGYFFSNEPGYYKEGDFGIRLENILEVIVDRRKGKHLSGQPYFKFKEVALVPYEPKLMDESLLTIEHRQWINNYNTKIRNLVGAELKRQLRMKGFYWMMRKTKHIPEIGAISGAISNIFNSSYLYVSIVILMLTKSNNLLAL